jgi:CRISPR-associated exonuclease Cas4
MPGLLIVVAIVLLACGFLFIWWGRRTRKKAGLPTGELVYHDTGAEEKVEAPLISRRYGLVGRPDYLVHRSEGKRKLVIPVEVKSRRRPASPHPGHILQLAAYCLMVEEVYGVTPPYGLLRYADATLQIPFTDELRRQVSDAAEAVRRARGASEVQRQHNEPERCRLCGYRGACGAAAL